MCHSTRDHSALSWLSQACHQKTVREHLQGITRITQIPSSLRTHPLSHHFELALLSTKTAQYHFDVRKHLFKNTAFSKYKDACFGIYY